MPDAVDVLRGRRILIVEDEMLIAMEMEDLVVRQGGEVVGPAPTAQRALDLLAQEPPDAAILDLNLNGTTAAPVGAALNARGVPFVLATGYREDQVLDAALRNAPRFAKPVNHRQLMRALVKVLER